jgi:hypothetical protein
MFYIGIKNKTALITESFYEVDPQTEEESIKTEETKDLNVKNKLATNQASNEDEAFKEMMRNFKTVRDAPPTKEDTEDTSVLENVSENTTRTAITRRSHSQNSKQHALQEEDRERFRKAKDIVSIQTAQNTTNNSSNNSNSSVSYSLQNRVDLKLPPPIYLCETGGKIIVNITVNSLGRVTDTYINTSSSSNNQCLIDTAIAYAENALFSKANQNSQIGSITYYFMRK